MMVSKFEDLLCWQLSRELNKEIYLIIYSETIRRDWPLRDQMNRSAASIMDNIAEGFGRNGRREFIQFLSYSKASCTELKSQLHRAIDRNYISQSKFEVVYDKADHVEKMITKFIQHMKKVVYKGWKFDG